MRGEEEISKDYENAETVNGFMDKVMKSLHSKSQRCAYSFFNFEVYSNRKLNEFRESYTHTNTWEKNKVVQYYQEQYAIIIAGKCVKNPALFSKSLTGNFY